MPMGYWLYDDIYTGKRVVVWGIKPVRSAVAIPSKKAMWWQWSDGTYCFNPDYAHVPAMI